MDGVPRKVSLVAHVRRQGVEKKESKPGLNISHYCTFKSIGHRPHYVTESFMVFARHIQTVSASKRGHIDYFGHTHFPAHSSYYYLYYYHQHYVYPVFNTSLPTVTYWNYQTIQSYIPHGCNFN